MTDSVMEGQIAMPGGFAFKRSDSQENPGITLEYSQGGKLLVRTFVRKDPPGKTDEVLEEKLLWLLADSLLKESSNYEDVFLEKWASEFDSMCEEQGKRGNVDVACSMSRAAGILWDQVRLREKSKREAKEETLGAGYRRSPL